MKTEVTILKRCIIKFALLVCLCPTQSVMADTLTVTRDGKEVSLVGEFLFKAQDKSILFQSIDGQLHVFTSEQIVDLNKEIEVAPSMDQKQLGESLLKDLPTGFKVLHTENYVIAYQTEPAFAKWIAELYEKRLISEFEKFSKKKLRYELSDSKFPLAVVVFGSRPEYDRYATRELGTDPGTMIAHYSQMTNRIAMYDLTFDLGDGDKARKLDDVLLEPAAIPMVTTIIHEATHQLMFNRGMQARLGDAPLWLNEGMANWFETPDLKNKNGWRRPGMINSLRLARVKAFIPNRPADSLETLVSGDSRFGNEGAFDAYAESWALVYFLLKHRRNEFCDYLKAVSSKQPGGKVDAETRLNEFTKHFGNLKKLDRAFLKYVNKLQPR